MPHWTAVISVLATVNDCFVHEQWREIASKLETSDIHTESGVSENISDATRLFCLVALRKLGDFLRDSPPNQDDLHWYSIGIDREKVLGRRTELLSSEARRLLNKSVVHLTERGDLEVEDYEFFDAMIQEVTPCLVELRRQLEGVLEARP